MTAGWRVSRAAVIGVPDHRWGETGLAFVVAGQRALSAAELTGWCHERLARHKVPPTRIEFVAELLRNATGKVLKSELRRSAATL